MLLQESEAQKEIAQAKERIQKLQEQVTTPHILHLSTVLGSPVCDRMQTIQLLCTFFSFLFSVPLIVAYG